MGTFGTGPFSSDGAMDFVEEMAELSADERAAVLEHLFSQARNRPDLLWREFFPDGLVAAAAIVAASVAGGEDIQRDLSDLVDDVDAVLLPAPGRELMASALQGLLFAAGPNGPWHDGWVSPEMAAEARQTSDRLTAILSSNVSKDH